jgi:hypothetical protein
VPRGEVVDANGRRRGCPNCDVETDADGRFTIDAGREYADGSHVPDDPRRSRIRAAKPREGWPAFVTPARGRGALAPYDGGAGVLGAGLERRRPPSASS